MGIDTKAINPRTVCLVSVPDWSKNIGVEKVYAVARGARGPVGSVAPTRTE
jgi:hypothetical protein